ncbi:MAG: SusC/RagA family TonB-linked outer membrane protein, partial [Chitinophagaceae bacterium]
MTLHLSVLYSFAQVKINGKITDPEGKALPSISVSIRNSSIGSASNMDGQYSIQGNIRPGTYNIDFSGVGFKPTTKSIQITDANSYTVDAEMAFDALNLEEIILTGVSAGTTRKQLGSYISSIKSDQLNKGATSNVLSSLQGKTAGAQIIQNSGDPAGGFSVRLRGISSILSSSEPLYIVDGIIVNNATNRVTNTQGNYDGNNFVGTIGQNRLSDINPADIDHIEVLNGAAAAAIYGSRANAGVIQIFTKKGVSGAPVISFSTGIMTNQLRKKIGVNKAPVKFGGPTDGAGALTQDLITTVGGALPTTTTSVTRYDYQDYIFQKGIGTDNNVSVSGGTEKTKY